MTARECENWILQCFEDIKVKNAYRERSFFYNPNSTLPNGIYFCTIKESDGPNDKASNLNRDDIYRLSFGCGKKVFQELFGTVPKRPKKGEIVEHKFDFTILNEFTPHPVYAWISWIAINSPEKNNLDLLQHFLAISYESARVKYLKRTKKKEY